MNEETLPNTLLTVRQVAQKLQVSTRTVWRLRSSRQLPEPVEIGGCVRWKAAELEKWIEEGCPVP